MILFPDRSVIVNERYVENSRTFTQFIPRTRLLQVFVNVVKSPIQTVIQPSVKIAINKQLTGLETWIGL